MKALTLIAVTLAGPVIADCPPIVDYKMEQARLLSEMKVAPNELAARRLSDALWALWVKAPDAKAQALLDTGMRAHRQFNHTAALDALDQLVDYCPDYAEGYNQRAFVYYTSARFEPALADLESALERHPEHLGALTGKALTLMGLGRNVEAQRVLRAALKINPWLSERRFLVDPEATDL